MRNDITTVELSDDLANELLLAASFRQEHDWFEYRFPDYDRLDVIERGTFYGSQHVRRVTLQLRKKPDDIIFGNQMRIFISHLDTQDIIHAKGYDKEIEEIKNWLRGLSSDIRFIKKRI